MSAEYKWIKEGVSYTVFHEENETKTMIAITDDSEKADFISKACNYFAETFEDDEEK